MPSLKLEDYSDRELLHLLADCADDDGTCTSSDIAESLGGSGKGLKEASRNVAIRLSWQKRYGTVDRDDKTGRWRLTGIGEQIVTGRLRAAQQRAIEAANGDGQVFELAHLIGRSMVSANPIAAKMMEREFRYATAQRRFIRNGSASLRATSKRGKAK